MCLFKKIIISILKKWFSVKKTYIHKTIEKLSFGFSEQATIDLENIINHSKYKPKDKSKAAFAMAHWNLIHGNFQKSYDLLIIARKFYPKVTKTENYYLTEINCLFEMQRYDEARITIDHLLKNYPKSSQLIIAKSNTFKNSKSPESDKLDCINEIYHDHELAKINKSIPDLPLQLDNLSTTITHGPTPTNQQAKLSIIIPAYSATNTLHIAVNSLRNQTWENIEIIIVDDCSPDETFSVAKKLAEQDPRIKVYKTPKNGGSYAARNLVLLHATGEFITVHDADDWSHPQKLEKQISHLINNPNFIANYSFWVRCSFQLEFSGAGHLNRNFSSLMLRRNVLFELGGWDEVRIEADAELFRRIRGRFGENSIYKVLENVPLAFALCLPDSLTQSSSTHIRTQLHGVRRIYREASQYYYEFFAKKNHWKIKQPNQQRVFPAPKLIQRDIPQKINYDLVIIMDYCLRGGSYVSTLNYLKAALASELRVAIFHWRCYELDPKSHMNSKIRQMVHEGAVDLICPGDEVFTNTVFVGYPAILQYVIDLTPKIHCERFAILTNEIPARLYNGRDIQYDPRIVSANVIRLFGIQPVWIPISNLVRNLMMKDERFESIHHENMDTYN